MSPTIASEDASPPLLAPEFPSQTLAGMLRLQARRFGGRPAAIDAGGQMTYRELSDRSTALAHAMAASGVTRGDRIGIICGNGAHWLTILFGGATAGATVVPLSTWSTPDELQFLIADGQLKLIFAAANFNGRNFAADAAEASKGQVKVVVIGSPGLPGCDDLEAFMAKAHGTRELPVPQPQDDALILYTSGSTSRPKGVRLTQGGVVENGFQIGNRMGLGPEDRVFLPAPLFWAYGACNALPATLSHGAALVLPERFEAGEALRMIAAHRCTAIYTLPAITTALIQHADYAPEKLSSLRTGLTIGSPEEFRLAVTRLGASELCNIYGATETYGNCAVTWHHWPVERRASCQGPLLPHHTVRFRDAESGEILPSGAVGLVEVSGLVSPGYTGVSSSYNESAFTADGFYRTGDMGCLDEQGAFVFVGRASEMIKRAGINVSPTEVEDAIMRFPGVSLAAVVGVPDERRGEQVIAFVIADAKADEILDHCRRILSKYKVPDRIVIVERLALTPTGKLQRRSIKQAALDLVAAEKGGPA